MRYSESYTNAGLSVVSPEGVKLTEQGIDGGTVAPLLCRLRMGLSSPIVPKSIV